VWFTAGLGGTAGGATDDSGIFRGAGAALVQVVREGQAPPDGNGQFGSLESSALAVNESGQVVFAAGLTGTAGGTSDDRGLWRADDSSLVEIARRGQAVPGGNGSFSVFISTALNDAGQSAFRATLTGTAGSGADNEGIYFFDEELGLFQVAREGDAFLGSQIDSLLFAPGGPAGEQGSGLARSGIPRVTYSFELADGRQGVAVWTLTVAGDFNGDGTVNAADYTVWRNGLGTLYTTDDFLVWKNNYGESIELGTASSLPNQMQAPEPAGTVLFGMGLLRLAAIRMRIRGSRWMTFSQLNPRSA
jgi:hypothetical protein